MHAYGLCKSNHIYVPFNYVGFESHTHVRFNTCTHTYKPGPIQLILVGQTPRHPNCTVQEYDQDAILSSLVVPTHWQSTERDGGTTLHSKISHTSINIAVPLLGSAPPNTHASLWLPSNTSLSGSMLP